MFIDIFPLLINGVLLTELCHLAPDIISFVLKIRGASQMHSAILGISSSFRPLVVMAGVPMRTPEVTKGLLGSLGTVFLFRVI